MKKLIMLAAITMVAVSCTKEQRSVNKLEGTWNIDKVEYNDGSTTTTDDNPTGTAEFTKCNLKDDEFCSYVIDGEASFYGISFDLSDNGEYRVQEEEIQFRENSDDTSYDVAQIEELKNKSFIMKSEDDDGYLKFYLTK